MTDVVHKETVDAHHEVQYRRDYQRRKSKQSLYCPIGPNYREATPSFFDAFLTDYFRNGRKCPHFSTQQTLMVPLKYWGVRGRSNGSEFILPPVVCAVPFTTPLSHNLVAHRGPLFPSQSCWRCCCSRQSFRACGQTLTPLRRGAGSA